MIKELLNIHPEEIHVWSGSFDLYGEATSRIKAILSPAEVKRAETFRFPEDRIRFIQAHTLLRHILSRYSGIDPVAIEFGAGIYGKPYLTGACRIGFNLSHTKDIVAVAISKDGDIGIDIERQDDMNDMEDLAGQFMTDEEFRSMRRLEQNLRKKYFYSCWVRKEALLKAAGIGLGDHLRQISVLKDKRTNETKFMEGCIEGKNGVWWLDSFDFADNHAGAVCMKTTLKNKDYSIQFQNVNMLNLIA